MLTYPLQRYLCNGIVGVSIVEAIGVFLCETFYDYVVFARHFSVCNDDKKIRTYPWRFCITSAHL